MATKVTKWADSNGALFDTEDEATRSDDAIEAAGELERLMQFDTDANIMDNDDAISWIIHNADKLKPIVDKLVGLGEVSSGR